VISRLVSRAAAAGTAPKETRTATSGRHADSCGQAWARVSRKSRCAHELEGEAELIERRQLARGHGERRAARQDRTDGIEEHRRRLPGEVHRALDNHGWRAQVLGRPALD
jgi:hypothetical protein